MTDNGRAIEIDSLAEGATGLRPVVGEVNQSAVHLTAALAKLPLVWDPEITAEFQQNYEPLPKLAATAIASYGEQIRRAMTLMASTAERLSRDQKVDAAALAALAARLAGREPAVDPSAAK